MQPETNEEYNARVDAHIAALAEQSGINVGPDTSAMAGPLPSEEQFNAHVLAVSSPCPAPFRKASGPASHVWRNRVL